MINITCNNKEVRSGTCADIGDSNVVAYISFFDTINNTERKLYQPVYGDFKTSTAYLFDLSGNSITLTYADSNKTRTELEDLLVDCCGCVGGDGTVTSFSAGNLSPLFTTNVATPTTTPALSFNLSNCNQYQVFGRVVAGTGAPSYVPLNPIAFNGLSLPNNQIAYGTGSGISSSSYLTYTGDAINHGDGLGTKSIEISSGGAVNDGGYILFKRGGSNTFLFGDDAAGFGGSSNDALAFVYGNNKYHIATNGVRRLTVGGNGYVTINNIPSSPSSTDILVSNSGVVSTRTVASLGIPVITPAALTKTDDTNVIMTLGGTPSTALLQNVSLTLGWNGVLSTARGGTGLGSLGAANQLLRVNTGGTALEYFTPTWTTNTGTVTSVGLSASGALSVTGSPVTGSGVMTLNWTGTTSQYVRGDGSLNTFPTIPVVQWSDSLVAYGRTSVGGLTYSTGLKYDYTNSAFSVGTRAAGSVGTGSVQLGGNSVISGGYAIGLGYQNTVSGNYSTASGYNHTVLANYCFVSGNANTQTNSSGVGSFLSGREISHGTGTYLFASGYLLTVSGHYSFTVGTENTNSGTYSAIIGRNGTVTHSGNVMLLDSGSGTNITSGTSNQFTARFYNGYRFMTTNTVRAMDISSSRVITIDNLAGSGTRMVVANSSGELSTQTIPSGANSVWYIQGTATDATTNAQDIVRTGKVRIGASGTSTYMLSVVGNAYIMNGVEINNNQSYKGFNTSATAVNLIKINSSNYIEVGQSTYDIYLPNYTSSRSADTVSTSDKYLYVNSSGYLKADSAKWVRNDGGTAYISSTESHAADSTYRQVTFDTVELGDDTFYTISGSSRDYRITFPSGYQLHYVVVTLEYTTSGTPTVTADIRRSAVAMETNISTSDDSRKVMTIHTTMVVTGGSGDYATVYLKVSGSAITLQKCRLTVIPLGIVRV